MFSSDVPKLKFVRAATIMKNLPEDSPIELTEANQLSLYKYYQQATIGNVNTRRPVISSRTDKANWDAWNSVKGQSSQASMNNYVNEALEILKNAGNADSQKYHDEITAAK